MPYLTPHELNDNASSGDDSEDRAALFNYPTLGRLFDGDDSARALGEIRARLTDTRNDLERVVRRGTQQDADRAACISRAFTVTLDFLDELDRIRRESRGSVVK